MPIFESPAMIDLHTRYDHLHQVKLLLGRDSVLRQGVEPGQVQHPAHQAGETAGL